MDRASRRPRAVLTAWPFVKSARVLLGEGHPADTVIEMWRPNTDEWAMRGRLGAVAATVIDGEAGSRGAKNGPPARDLEKDGGKGRPLACALPRAVSGAGDTPSNEANTLGGARRPRRGSDLNDVAKLSPAGEQASSRAAQLKKTPTMAAAETSQALIQTSEMRPVKRDQ